MEKLESDCNNNEHSANRSDALFSIDVCTLFFPKFFRSFIYMLIAVLRIPLMRRSCKMTSTRTIYSTVGKRLCIFRNRITLRR